MSKNFAETLVDLYTSERSMAHDAFEELSGANDNATAQAQANAAAAQAQADAAQAGALSDAVETGAKGAVAVAVVVVVGLVLGRTLGKR